MDIGVYLKFLLALIFVLGLIGAAAWAARRFGLGGTLAPNTGKARRLSVVEVMPLDARRKLVLLRRDEVEHLVLLGPGTDLHMESGPAAREAAAMRPELKVLFTSGFAEYAGRRYDILDDDAALIAKPYRKAALASHIRQILDEAPADRDLQHS